VQFSLNICTINDRVLMAECFAIRGAGRHNASSRQGKLHVITLLCVLQVRWRSGDDRCNSHAGLAYNGLLSHCVYGTGAGAAYINNNRRIHCTVSNLCCNGKRLYYSITFLNCTGSSLSKVVQWDLEIPYKYSKKGKRRKGG